MASTYDAVVAALRAHWAVHDNKQPQKLVLSFAQHDELTALRRTGRAGLNASSDSFDTEIFMGVRVERSDKTSGLLVGIDGSESPLNT